MIRTMIVAVAIAMVGCASYPNRDSVTQHDEVYDEDIVAVDVPIESAEVTTASALSDYEGTLGGIETQAPRTCEAGWQQVFVMNAKPSNDGTWVTIYRRCSARVQCTWWPSGIQFWGSISCSGR